MGIRRIVTCLCSALLLYGIVLATANAQGLANQKTYFTFSHPVELPGGVTLQPGKYTFKLADTQGSRHVVQIFNEDETEIIASMLTVSAERLEPSEDSVITFAEASAAAPQPIRYWYYPGRRIGHEFVYPKDQAERIARATKMPVLATESAVTEADDIGQARIETIEPSGEVGAASEQARVETEQVVDIEQQQQRESGAVEDVEAEGSAPRGTSGEAESQIARSELPATASFDPLVGLIGLMSFGGFVLARMKMR